LGKSVHLNRPDKMHQSGFGLPQQPTVVKYIRRILPQQPTVVKYIRRIAGMRSSKKEKTD